MPVPMSRGKESAGWSAGRLASWRLSSNDVHVHIHPYGPYLLPPMLITGAATSAYFSLELRTYLKVTFSVVGKCKVGM